MKKGVRMEALKIGDVVLVNNLERFNVTAITEVLDVHSDGQVLIGGSWGAKHIVPREELIKLPIDESRVLCIATRSCYHTLQV